MKTGRNTIEDGANQNDDFIADATCPALINGDEIMESKRAAYFYSGINAVEVSGDGIGDNDGICEANEKCFDRFLTHATEIVGDKIGDDDGLCESNEACLYSPNFGVYQGEGDYSNNKCEFEDGAVSGVTMYAYPQNGG